MTDKPSREDVLKLAGEPFGYFCDWGDYQSEQRIAMYYGEPGSASIDDWNEMPKVHKNKPLYTEAQLLAMYAAGAEWMREAVRNSIRSLDDGEAPEYRACEEAISALPITPTNTEGEQ